MPDEPALSRRSLAALFAVAPAAGLQAQPAPAPPGEQAGAAQALGRNLEALSKVPVPRNTEPAFHFKP
ncbi:MAG: hypothetical protein HY858_16835 [Candidatus Solibacter usitatus]|nr:hypothetical protein [Candidatus Solibacter usitatus]